MFLQDAQHTSAAIISRYQDSSCINIIYVINAIAKNPSHGRFQFSAKKQENSSDRENIAIYRKSKFDYYVLNTYEHSSM